METLTLKLDSTTKYLQFWNSFFGLTKKECCRYGWDK
jgi:hypothetical protein